MKRPTKSSAKPKVKKKKRPGYRGEPSPLGAKLLAALARAGLNARDLAFYLGVHETTVMRWFSRKGPLPYLLRVRVIECLGADAC